MYTQKTRNSKFLFLMLALVMAITSVVGYCFAGTSKTSVYASDGLTASITKRSSTAYYKGQKVSIDLGDGQDPAEYTNIPDLTAWQITVYYGDKSVSIDAQQALINRLKNNTEKDQIYVDGFTTSGSEAAGSLKTNAVYKGKFKISIILSEQTRDELGYYTSMPGTVDVSISDISYTVYESSDKLAGAENVTKILNTFNSVLQNILSPIIGVMIAIGAVFAIFLGAKLAKANNSEEREEAKKRVIYTVIGIAIGVALIILFNLFATYSVEWLGDGNFFSL